MKVLGYVNRYGGGIIRAQSALVKNGNPEAEFGHSPAFTLVTVRSAA